MNMPEKSLNPEQEKAVLHGRGPAMVLAGPGSGKTFVLTKRIKHLILHHHINPQNILTITFTRAAAMEMKKRAVAMEKQAAQAVFGTFHSIFFQILRTSYPYSQFTIITEGEKQQIVKEILYRTSVPEEDIPSMTLTMLKEINRIKAKDCTINEYEGGILEPELFRRIYGEYEKELLFRKKVDFDGILFLCRDYLTQDKKALGFWQNRFSFFLIDEFQDINRVQYEVISLLASKSRNLFAVGDDDQSIYGFRGSKPGFMKEFLKDFPNAAQIVLNTNYRSRKEIVDVAGKSISHNKNRFPKRIVSGREEQQEEKEQRAAVTIHIWKEEQEEIEHIIQEIQKSPCEMEKMAVLFRTNQKAQLFAEKLFSHDIPYVMKEKPENFYEHPIVRDILAYLRFAHMEQRRSYFYQFMNKPLRYIRREAVTSELVDFQELYIAYFGKRQMLANLRKLEKDISFLKTLDAYAGISYVLKAIGYEAYSRTKTGGNMEKWKEQEEILQELKKRAKEFHSGKEFLAFIDAYTVHFKETAENRKQEEQGKGIRLMTYHGSKGLEFKEVYLPFLVGGVVPYHKAATEEEMEEERRMFYVAMTRAEDKLCMSATENGAAKRSVFLEELGDGKQV
ncbi:MAG: ATP-dependent helicase [Lachnospiraceae bacterium]|nr:ATP-dependent helicase [Lachnospiraceae bacterium]